MSTVVMVGTQYYDDCYDEADNIMIDESDMLAVFGKRENVLYAESCARKKNIKIIYF